MSALDRLKSRLVNRLPEGTERTWPIDVAIDRHIKELDRRVREGQGVYVSKDLQQEALKKFWIDRQVDSLKSARLIAFGIALPIGPNQLKIIESEKHITALAKSIEGFKSSPRQFRRCYQGLLLGYLAYDPSIEHAPEQARINWKKLRSYLKSNVQGIVDSAFNPQWVDVLLAHSSLFDDNPCLRYGPALLQGDRTEVDQLRDVLGISDSSWFMRQLYLAGIESAIQLLDAAFLDVLDQVLDWLRENEIIRDQGLAMILDRYAALENPAPRKLLRDFAVETWGNPWLQSNAARWGRVSLQTRKLVTEWLKLEFIEAFFTVLAEQGTEDKRRLNFWKRYVHAIDDIHFALGTVARDNRSPDFVALRKKVAGLTARLDHTSNAFIMHMGPVVIVEFSGYSNACYGYSLETTLPFDYSRSLAIGVDTRNSLKQSKNKFKLTHNGSWEEQFARKLDGLGIKPKAALAGRATRLAVTAQPNTRIIDRTDDVDWDNTTFTSESLHRFTEKFGFKVEDRRPNNGNLWVHTRDTNQFVNSVLQRWGFKYRWQKAAWWIE